MGFEAVEVMDADIEELNKRPCGSFVQLESVLLDLFDIAINDERSNAQREYARITAYNKALTGLFGAVAVESDKRADVLQVTMNCMDQCIECAPDPNSAIKTQKAFVSVFCQCATTVSEKDVFVSTAEELPEYIEELNKRVRSNKKKYSIEDMGYSIIL